MGPCTPYDQTERESSQAGKPMTQEEIINRFQLHPITAEILYSRGFRTQEELFTYLEGDLSQLHSPHSIPGIAELATWIRERLGQGVKWAIFCDYDVDGLCGAVILQQALSRLPGAKPFIFPSQRERDGYGLSPLAVQELARQGVQLLITVDCGIANQEEIARAQKEGMEVLIIDHHEASHLPEVPFLDLKVNPGSYPFSGLCGAALAWKLAQFLLEEPLTEYCDLVALATIADVAQLKDENRILVQEGLKRMQEGKGNPGLQTLLQLKGLEKRTIKTHHLGFQIAPLLNASGRLGSPQKALDLLTSHSLPTRKMLAAQLEEANRKRQALTRKAVAEARQGIDPRQNVLLYQGKIPAGILGLVAGELREEYNKGAIIIGEGGRGSGRSMAPLNLYHLLKDCQEHLSSFGGHSMAAGLTLKEGAYPALEQAIQELTQDLIYQEQPWDVVVEIQDLTPALFQDLERLEPYGNGNSRPLFSSLAVQAQGIRILPGGNLGFHSQGREFMGYGMKELAPLCRQHPLQILYHPPARGEGALILKEIRPS